MKRRGHYGGVRDSVVVDMLTVVLFHIEGDKWVVQDNENWSENFAGVWNFDHWGDQSNR